MEKLTIHFAVKRFNRKNSSLFDEACGEAWKCDGDTAENKDFVIDDTESNINDKKLAD